MQNDESMGSNTDKCFNLRHARGLGQTQYVDACGTRFIVCGSKGP